MKQIIEDVVQAEEKVNAILKQARVKASEITRSTEKEISDKLSEAKEQAQEIMKATMEEGRKKAERIREEKLKQADLEKEALVNSNAHAMTGLVDQICNIILSTEHDS